MRRVPLLVFAASLIATGVFAYSTSFDGVLVMDDIAAVSSNVSIQSLSTAFSPPPTTTVSGRPVANVTFAIDHAISGPNPWGYHATNLAIHVAAALVLFALLQVTFREASLARTAGAASTWLAWAIALIWVAHPLHTSAVTYVVQRVESLMSLWLLLTMYCSVRAGERGASSGWTAGAIVCCALGMATKEVMVVTPLLVWLWYRTFRRGPLPRVVLLLPLTWLVLIPLVSGAPRGQTAGFGAGGWTAWSYLVTQAGVVVHYLRLVFYPVPLVFHYAWKQPESIIQVAPQALLMVLLLLITVIAVVRRHPIGFASAWFFGILAPSSSIVPVATEVAAEHRMYLPSAAVIAVVVTLLFALARALLRRERAALLATTAVVIVAAVALGAETRNRNRDYWSEERLWGDNIAKQPGSPRGQLGYALAMVRDRRWTEAETHAQIAVQLEPANPLAHRTLAFSYFGENRLVEAAVELERAIALYPDDAVAQRALVQIRAALSGS